MIRPRLLPLLLVTSLALASCGSGDGDGTTSTSSSTGSTATTTTTGTTTSATTGSGVAVLGSGYGFELTGPRWADQRSNPQVAGQNYDIVYFQGPPGTTSARGRIVAETMRKPIPASEAAKSDVLERVLGGAAQAAKQDGSTLGEPQKTTLGGDAALSVTLDGKSASGSTYSGLLLIAVHDDAVYSLSFVSPTERRSELPALQTHARETWAWK